MYMMFCSLSCVSCAQYEGAFSPTREILQTDGNEQRLSRNRPFSRRRTRHSLTPPPRSRVAQASRACRQVFDAGTETGWFVAVSCAYSTPQSHHTSHLPYEFVSQCLRMLCTGIGMMIESDVSAADSNTPTLCLLCETQSNRALPVLQFYATEAGRQHFSDQLTSIRSARARCDQPPQPLHRGRLDA